MHTGSKRACWCPAGEVHRSLAPCVRTRRGTTGVLFPHRARLLCLSRLYPLESRLGSFCRGFSPGCLPCPALLLLPEGVSMSLPRCPEFYGLLCDSQGPMALLPHPGSHLCLSPAKGLFISVMFCPHPLLPPGLPAGPGGALETTRLSRGLSKTCSVCPLLSQPVKVCSCPPEL